MNCKLAEDLVQRIEREFSIQPFQGREPICPHDCWECRDLADTVRGKSWMDFSPQQVRWICDGTSLLSHEAFDYFLPAYLCASLIDAKQASQAVDATAWCYLSYGPSDRPNRTAEGLTAGQRKALYDWLDWYIETLEDELRESERIVPADKARAKHLSEFSEEYKERIARNRRELRELRVRFPAD